MLIPQNVQRRRAVPVSHAQLATASASARHDFLCVNADLESLHSYHTLTEPLYEIEDMERWCHTQITEIDVMNEIPGTDCASTTEHSTTSYPAFSSTASTGSWSDALFTDFDLAACANARPYARESATTNHVAASKVVKSSSKNTNTNTPKTKKHKRRRHVASSTIRRTSVAKGSSGNVDEELNSTTLNKPNKERRAQGTTKGRTNPKNKCTTMPGNASRSAAGEGAAGVEREGSGWKKLPHSIAMRLLFGVKPKRATASAVTEPPQVPATSSKAPASQQVTLEQRVERNEMTTKSRKRSREQVDEACGEKARKVQKM